MPRINAVSFYEDPSMESICHKIRDAGFDSMEMSRSPFYDKLVTQQTRRTFRQYLTSMGMSMYGFDSWVPINPYEARAASLEGMAAAFEFANDLELDLVIAGEGPKALIGHRTPAQCMEILVPFFEEMVIMAADHSLTVVFEPHPDTLSMDDSFAKDLVDRVNQPNFGIVYDCCHYGVGQPKTYLNAIENLGHRIRHVHFSDGDCETSSLHLPPGEGRLDLAAITATLKGIGFSGTLTCDMFNYPLLEDGARRMVEPIRQVEQELGLATP